MGLLAEIFGLRSNEAKVPILTTLVPAGAVNEINNGHLPQFNTSTIMLSKGETCRFIDRAALVTTKKAKHYESRRSGSSYRLFKGLTIHSGRSKTTPIEEIITEYTEGIIYVTDTRIIFTSKDKGFEKKIKNLTAVLPYSDAVGLQYGNQTINIMVPQSDLIIRLLQMLY